MVLLTQSQVGVALSSLVIFLCTSALFLSGYVVQQKTLRDIQKAIKPQVAPLNAGLDVPSQFRSNDFWDGNEGVAQVQNVEIKPSQGADESMVGATRWQKAKKLKENEEKQKALLEKRKVKKGGKTSFWGRKKVVDEEDERPLSDAARRKKIKEQIIAAGDGEAPQGYRRKWY